MDSQKILAKTKPGAWEYDIVYPPAYKCNMTDIMASLEIRTAAKIF